MSTFHQNDSKLCAYGVRFYNWPGGEGPAEHFGMTHAVYIPPNTGRVVIGGQLGIQDDGSVSPDLAQEVKEVFDHVERALKAAGLGDDAWEHVYSVKTFEVPNNKGELVSEVITPIARSYLKQTRPAWTGVTTSSLVDPRVHLEMTVEAFVPNPKAT